GINPVIFIKKNVVLHSYRGIPRTESGTDKQRSIPERIFHFGVASAFESISIYRIIYPQLFQLQRKLKFRDRIVSTQQIHSVGRRCIIVFQSGVIILQTCTDTKLVIYLIQSTWCYTEIGKTIAKT